MRRIILLVCGYLMVGLGALGILLPVVPTTPFILVAAACFSSSSPRLYRWLANTRYFGPYIENYRTKEGVPVNVKVVSLGFLWGLLLLSALLSHNIYVSLVLAVVGIGVTLHILLLKTKVVSSK